MGERPAIETCELSKWFGGRVAVAGLSLRVGRGQIIGLVGPAGAGKTTVLRLLLGQLRPSAGAAFVLGHDVARRRGAPAGVGALVGAPAFAPALTGRENLLALGRAAGHLAPGRVDAALAAVGLERAGAERARTYTPTTARRLAIAAALLGQPELLLLDEPAAGLGRAGAAEIGAALRELRGAGRTILLTSAPSEELAAVCDELALIHRGRMLTRARPGELCGGGLLVEAEPLPLLRAVVQRMGLAAWPISPRSLSVALDPAEAPRLVAALRSAGASIVQVAPRQLTLEEHFRETGQ